MPTQTSIKLSLAYSTIAQIGFMMLQCGLGAFPAALLHIVAHSLYKAHAFLSSGSVVDIARAAAAPAGGAPPHPARLVLALAAGLALALGAGAAFGASPAERPGVFALGAILTMGLTQLLANAIDRPASTAVLGRALARAALVAAGYFALQRAAEALFADALPSGRGPSGPFDIALVAAVVAGFAAVTVLQNLPPRWPALQLHLANGLYVNTLANRLIIRLWPSRPRGAQ
jgi:NAD(P)H-quinone oxidoreductase subunit 5